MLHAANSGLHAFAQDAQSILTLQIVCTGRRVQGERMWSTVAELAVQAVHTLQVLASHGRLPGGKYASDQLRSQAKQAFLLPAMNDTYDKLIYSFAELLSVLKTTATRQQKIVASGNNWSPKPLVSLSMCALIA